MSDAPQTVLVLATSRGTDSLRVHCELSFDPADYPYFGPLAPCALDMALYNNPFCDLHRVIEKVGRRVVFERFDSLDSRVPEIGKTYFYRGYWTPEFLDAAMDTDSEWALKDYPDNGDHDHSLFTWETIAAYADHKQGYFNERYGWVTIEAYTQFIQGDLYRLREARTL
ncbi:MAG: hypothetical protein QM667_05645 [Asticcacaulis sp.]